MNDKITLSQLQDLVHLLSSEAEPARSAQKLSKPTLLAAIAVRTQAPECPDEIAKLESALSHLSSDVGRGTGSFYMTNGEPCPDYWLAAIWAIRSLNWSTGQEIAKNWSMKSPRYDDLGFESAWKSYDPSHPSPIGIGSLYKAAAALGWHSPLPQTATQLNSSRFNLLSGQSLINLPPLEWAVKGVLPATGIAAIYGPSGSGKSFLALDMAAAIATGNRWFGHRTRKTPVVYVALEGEAGYRNRVLAWESEHGKKLTSTLEFVLQNFSVIDPNDVSDLAANISLGSVIIIDTLNRTAPTADENSSSDMGKIIDGVKKLQSITCGLVILIHHTGKDVGRGLRGHSSLIAALDAAIEVKNHPIGKSWQVSKAKDSISGTEYSFVLKHHILGADVDGDSITSCTVSQNFMALDAAPAPTGKNQIAALDSITRALGRSTTKGQGGCPSSKPCIKFTDAIAAVEPSLKVLNQIRSKHLAKTVTNNLVQRGNICKGEENGDKWLWLPS